MVSLATLIKDIGIPSLFFAIVLWICFKTVPDIVKFKRESDIKQQEYYSQRQKTYDSQMQILIKVAEQGNQVITRSNYIIEQNTEAIKQNTAMHTKVIDALGWDLKALESLSADLKAHDNQSQKIYHDVSRILDRTNN